MRRVSVVILLVAAGVSLAQYCSNGDYDYNYPDCSGATDSTCSGTCTQDPLLETYFCCPADTTAGPTTTKATTKATTAAACADKISNCASYSAYCSNSAYKSMLSQDCPLTCKFCTACADAEGSSICTSTFCSSSSYTTATKKAYCAKTCGLC